MKQLIGDQRKKWKKKGKFRVSNDHFQKLGASFDLNLTLLVNIKVFPNFWDIFFAIIVKFFALKVEIGFDGLSSCFGSISFSQKDLTSWFRMTPVGVPQLAHSP